MGEYALHVKLKNNLILKRIEGAGYRTVGEFCREHNLPPTLVGELVNLKAKPVTKTGQWRELTQRMADALGCEPDDLFTEQQRETALPTNQSLIEVTEHQLRLMTDPAVALERSEFVEKLISQLRPREEKVLRLRYFDGKTYEEVGDEMGVSIERVRQLHNVALRKLRHPDRYAALGVRDTEAFD